MQSTTTSDQINQPKRQQEATAFSHRSQLKLRIDVASNNLIGTVPNAAIKLIGRIDPLTTSTHHQTRHTNYIPRFRADVGTLSFLKAVCFCVHCHVRKEFHHSYVVHSNVVHFGRLYKRYDCSTLSIASSALLNVSTSLLVSSSPTLKRIRSASTPHFAAYAIVSTFPKQL
jgi:hypothetical protein